MSIKGKSSLNLPTQGIEPGLSVQNPMLEPTDLRLILSFELKLKIKIYLVKTLNQIILANLFIFKYN